MNSVVGIIILAAGLGKRMKSDKAKVLHEVAGRTMIDYVVRAATQVVAQNVVVVVGHQAEQVKQEVLRNYQVYFAEQKQQLGTGHAVMCAMTSLLPEVQEVIVLCGDVPLIASTTLQRIIADHQAQKRDVTVLAVKMKDPRGYGRIIIDDHGDLTGIVEQTDADLQQQKIDLINTGIYAINRSFLEEALPLLRASNAQKEIYLTDIVGLGYRQGRKIGVLTGDSSDEIFGVNCLQDLEKIEKIIKIRRYEKS